MPPTKSKKFSIFVAILILFIGIFVGGFLFVKNRAGSANIENQIDYLLGKEKSVATQDKNFDSDNDGLPDWQEKVYGTDPKKPDTDGDGYLDGEEVASGYNPLKKAPNDELAGADTKKPRPLPKNMTKALAKTLSNSIVKGKIKSFNQTTGKPLTSEELMNDQNLDRAIQEAIGQQIKDFIVPAISDREIKISDKVGRQETLNYFNKMGDAVGQIPSDKPEMEIFAEAMESGDFSEVKEIQKIYEQNYGELKQVDVPSDLAEFHKGILGVLWVTANIYEAVANIREDPLKAAIAIMQYEKIDEETNQLINKAIEQINKAG